MRVAIAEALWHQSANDLADVCLALGLGGPDGDDPFTSKRQYVRRRLHGLTAAELMTLGRRTIEEYGDPGDDITAVLASFGPQGVAGELKNLIFAADGPKPRIVLRDAINNVIEIVENAQHCLVYDRPLTSSGLSWGELCEWWAASTTDQEGQDANHPRALFRRLRRSLSSSSPPERVLFDAYASRYGRPDAEAVPALIPQVYLHYDPYTVRELARGPGQTLVRQRMDFLLLLPGRVRVVVEVDGKQHYSEGNRPSPERYAEMVREDRRLRLDGYEVYRFGAAELLADDGPTAAERFFDQLLERHRDSA